MQTVCNESEREEEQGALAAGLCARLPRIPLFFLGLGMYRAWIEISFVGSFVSFPTQQFAGHDTFDFAMIATLFLCALFAKKIGPLFKKKLVYGVAGTLLVVSTLCIFLTLFIPPLAPLVAVPAAVGGGIGIAFVILLWSELYSCLNPIRVALYYSASIILAAFIIYVCRGFLYPWLFVAVLALPIATLACLVCGFKSLPANELPQAEQGKFSFPWKPVLLMSIYAFAYGLREAQLYSGSFGPHSAFGTVAVAAVVFIGVVARGGKFDFALMYRIALPLMVGAFLVLPGFGFMNQSMSNFCVSASYTAFSILIMLILANMSYRYGMSAIWLFSIERGVRALFSLIGRQAEAFMSTTDFGAMPSDVMIGAVVVLLIVACSVILFSEKELSSRWGVTFLGGTEGEGNKAILKKQELANRCQDLARQCGLSQREEEVLLLLAQHKTVGAIERELFIANGTAKTHTRHIYRKLDIHSRDELFEKLDLYE